MSDKVRYHLTKVKLRFKRWLVILSFSSPLSADQTTFYWKFRAPELPQYDILQEDSSTNCLFSPLFVRKTKKHGIKCRPSYWLLSAKAVISRLYARSTCYNRTARLEISEASQYGCSKSLQRCNSEWWLLEAEWSNF